MKKLSFIIVILLFGLSACEKKSEPQQHLSESTEFFKEIDNATPQQNTESPTEITQSTEAPTTALPDTQMAMTDQEPAAALNIIDKPSIQDIQQALKSANLYQGKIDGALGPKTKKAIEDFQTKNNLKIDGKVGPKTWEKLKTYLISSVSTPEAIQNENIPSNSEHATQSVSD